MCRKNVPKCFRINCVNSAAVQRESEAAYTEMKPFVFNIKEPGNRQ